MSTFYDMINKKGGVLDTSALPDHEKWMAERVQNLWAKTREVHNSSEILYPFGNARFELVRNDSMNAFAHYHSGEEGICIGITLP